jgi:hypothetical protein
VALHDAARDVRMVELTHQLDYPDRLFPSGGSAVWISA